MQFSKLALIGLISHLASAAPLFVTVTEVVHTTVFVEGQTQALDTVVASTPSQTLAAESTTAAVTTTTPLTTAAVAVAAVTTESTAEPTTTTTATSSSTDSSTDSSDDTEILNAHNAKRALHGVSDLTWDTTLATYAQNYADAYDCSGTLTHSGGEYGENLALGYTITGAVDAWYSEGDSYDYSTCNTYDHFTQVIWKSTTKLGCGYKTCDNVWGTYVICSYNPAGNFVGECPDNVLELV